MANFRDEGPLARSGQGTATVRIAPSLRFMLPSHLRHGVAVVTVDGTSSLTHVVEALGVPRTEVGPLRVNGGFVDASTRLRDGDVLDVSVRPRPEPIDEPRFVLDVHLGVLARRMRLLGIDVAYRNDATDDELVAQAADEQRVLLTQDRGLLRRRALVHGGYVLGDAPDEQLADVLSRFEPVLHPWSRCPACNGDLERVAKSDVEHLLRPGTRRSYAEFSRCRSCGRPYWRGAHTQRLDAMVAAATGQQRPPAP
jgi:uncharacterized protein with PIN domain